ncbi:MAG: outer membrane protein assembly factor BamC [Bacteroidia bacterium]|nr:MAG: outer membrane protein assembly factor BamC [Bacteroidia bacterium]
MLNIKKIISNSILLVLLFSAIAGCSSISEGDQYSTVAPRGSDTLIMPPNLNAPEINNSYELSQGNAAKETYQLNTIKNMKVVQGGSERWLVITGKSVDQVWPMLISYLSQAGLKIKFQNKAVGVIQTDWSTRNNVVRETGIRDFFDWVGWGSMYSMTSQYMFRINLWQNGSDTQIFVTDYQMNEVYPGCVKPMNSSIETSDRQITRWMAIPPDPQLELDFLLHFMAFAGLDQNEILQQKAMVTESNVMIVNAEIVNHQLIINDQFDRAWWRVGLALERVGLGINDKNRSKGEYYVYQLQSQVDNPDPGVLARWFGSEGNNLEIPKAEFLVKIISHNQQTEITINPTENYKVDKKTASLLDKYLVKLKDQLK